MHWHSLADAESISFSSSRFRVLRAIVDDETGRYSDDGPVYLDSEVLRLLEVEPEEVARRRLRLSFSLGSLGLASGT